PPHPGELHLDLLCWIGLMSRSLTSLAATLDQPDDTKTYQRHLTNIVTNLDVLHWSPQDSVYCDATIDAYDEHTTVCHKGYISLFPMMTNLLPHDHKNIPAILDLIASKDDLWSLYGIRSLSTKDELYGTDENYWRSPIWVNMNYLVVKALHDLAVSKTATKAVKAKSAKMYEELRQNLVNNVVKQWKDTGFAWEQYNPDTGAGQRTQHFTGWTSLVTLIMAMPDVGIEGISHGEL
ncbi:Processing alpha glucosidase I, partial [Elasticomyces elasticus]